jgi:hypothetical protein
MLRTRIFLVGLVVIALAGNAWSQSQQPSPPQTQATQPNKSAAEDERSTENAPFIVTIPPPTQAAQESTTDTKSEQKESTSDDKVADFTERLYWATFALAVIASFQLLVFGWQGMQLKRTVQHLAISERAHVSGGANRARRKDDGSDVLVVTINNYGKTPAFIGTVAATVCKKEELTNFPGWQVKAWKGYVFGPMPGQLSDIVFPYEKDKVIAGRIWYRDIFRKCYSVGFVLNTDDLTAVGDHDSYWEEREEKNIRPESFKGSPEHKRKDKRLK